MKESKSIRLYWIVFMPAWLLITCTLVVPILWYILTGLDWIDPEVVYDRLKENEQRLAIRDE